jgi:hypothetical protein
MTVERLLDDAHKDEAELCRFLTVDRTVSGVRTRERGVKRKPVYQDEIANSKMFHLSALLPPLFVFVGIRDS